MSNLAYAPPRMSPAEYLVFEERSPVKHEYVDGYVYAMVGATDRHNLIAQNLLIALRSTRPTGCQVFISDMKLKVRLLADEYFYYPDVLMSCEATDRDPLFREQPVLLIEVASPSTARIDRGEKLNNYRQLPSLREYVIAEQDRRQVGDLSSSRRVGPRGSRSRPTAGSRMCGAHCQHVGDLPRHRLRGPVAVGDMRHSTEQRRVGQWFAAR